MTRGSSSVARRGASAWLKILEAEKVGAVHRVADGPVVAGHLAAVAAGRLVAADFPVVAEVSAAEVRVAPGSLFSFEEIFATFLRRN